MRIGDLTSTSPLRSRNSYTPNKRLTTRLTEGPGVPVRPCPSIDPFEYKDHRVEQGQHHLPYTVVIVPLSKVHVAGHRVLESDLGEKSMQKIGSVIVRQTLFAKSNGKFSGSVPHGGLA